MGKVNDATLFKLVHDFFKVYQPKLANRSPNTIYAYRESLEALFDFVKSEKCINLSEITFVMAFISLSAFRMWGFTANDVCFKREQFAHSRQLHPVYRGHP